MQQATRTRTLLGQRMTATQRSDAAVLAQQLQRRPAQENPG
jgi:hypothetical protein